MDEILYSALVKTMQDGLLVVDTEGSIKAVNPAFCAMTGYSCNELIGKPCTILNCTGCKIIGKGPGSAWCNLFLMEEVRRRRCEIAGKDGRTIYVLKSATVLHDKEGKTTGAVETITDVTEMVKQEEKIQSLKSSLYHQPGLFGIMGCSEPIRKLLELIRNVARSDAPVLIYGESGVGKELVARAIHESGARAEGSFIKVNCASLNENLLESELFGHVRGAFTGAARTRIGRFEAASGGSIFLDEIGDVSPAIQVKLLRVLESREIERVGDHRPIPVDAKIITATNRDLEDLVSRGLFRADLFYRINVVPIHVPPLRERKEDIPILAQGFIEKIAGRSGKRIDGMTCEALELMMSYDWPGNVRELRNAIEYAFVLCNAPLIGRENLAPRIMLEGARNQTICSDSKVARNDGSPLFISEKERLIEALRSTGGNQTEAAKLLGISRIAVWKRMKKHGVTIDKCSRRVTG